MRTSLTALALGALLAASAAGCSNSTTSEPGARSATTSAATTSAATTSTAAATSGPPMAETHIGDEERGSFRIVSPAFAAGGTIPAKFTCDGAGVSPPIQWNAVPDGTQSLALVMVDPDAPRPGGFTHWVLAGLDPPGGGVGEATTEGVPGPNDAGTTGWTGPCPPEGTHTYVFTLYAFDHAADFGGTPTRAAIEAEAGVRGTATLTATYR